MVFTRKSSPTSPITSLVVADSQRQTDTELIAWCRCRLGAVECHGGVSVRADRRRYKYCSRGGAYRSGPPATHGGSVRPPPGRPYRRFRRHRLEKLLVTAVPLNSGRSISGRFCPTVHVQTRQYGGPLNAAPHRRVTYTLV